jgi:hypothetical protein
MLEAMNDTIIGAIIGAAATLAATIPAWLLEHNRRKEAEKKTRKREMSALQRVVDRSHEIQVLNDPSLVDTPEYIYYRAHKLRQAIFQAQGALPEDSEARPTLDKMQTAAGELRRKYRMLERPIGRPDPVAVAHDDFEPDVQEFRTTLAPLLDDLKSHILPAQQDHIQSAQLGRE